MNDKVLNSTEDAADLDDDLIDLEALLNDDTYMHTVSWPNLNLSAACKIVVCIRLYWLLDFWQ